MTLYTLTEVATKMQMSYNAAFFNTQLKGFPEPVEQNLAGENLYDFDAIMYWEHNRPTDTIPIIEG